jgi:prepilin peptidase CpaA
LPNGDRVAVTSEGRLGRLVTWPDGVSLPVVPAWAAVAVVVVACAAVVFDVRSRRIPNALTGPAWLLALVAWGIAAGGGGVLRALGGTAIAAAILLPGWLRGWMGAGDVKLMMALGAWLAWPAALLGTLASLIAGGVIAVLVALRHRALGRAVRGAAALATAPAGATGPAHSGLRFPFATAIFAGSFLALWVRL